MRLTDQIMRQHAIVRRALAVLLVFLALAVARFALIAPAHALVLSQVRWRTQARHRLAIAKGRATAEGALREQLNMLPKELLWSRLYPLGGAQSPDTALRADLKRLAASAGVTVESFAPLPSNEEGALQRHGMRIAASMTIGQLERLVTDLRHQSRYLRVEHLTISAPLVQPPHTNPPLLVRMDVYGYSASRRGGAG